MAVGALWADVTIGITCAADHAVTQIPFCDVDLEPALSAQALVTFAWSMEPGQQVLRSGPEGTQQFEPGEPVHRHPFANDMKALRGTRKPSSTTRSWMAKCWCV
jgi:hypothetical protein